MGTEVWEGSSAVIPGTVVRPRAKRDAEEIFAYIARDNIDAARRFNIAIADTLIAVRDNPKLGIAWRARSGRLTGVRWKRVRGFKKYLLFYRAEPNQIVLVRILHGARDVESILNE
jgi:toxin ParE1/3/4